MQQYSTDLTIAMILLWIVTFVPRYGWK